MKNIISILLIAAQILILSANSFAQKDDPINPGNLSGQELSEKLNVITTATPFLMVAPDSRSGAMGDVGVAISPDANAIHWNPAKLVFIENDMGVALSYTPWLRNLVDDISIAYLSGYYRLDKRQVVGASVRYFSLGNINFTDNSGNLLNTHNPNEFALTGSYSMLMSKHFSGGISMRYIYSNLTGGAYSGNTKTHPGHAVSADISAYYQNDIKISDKKANLAFGLNISNIGTKISYTDDSEQHFLPINMRLGTALTTEIDAYNKVTLALDVNKLLVPTPPARVDGEIIEGMDDDVAVPTGIFQSFSDAPGGMKEELHEIMYSVGLEYWYANQFAVRAGYFNEHETKGNRKYFTVGVGLKLNVFGVDFAYLIPTAQNHPMQNTVRFSLLFDFEAFRKQQEEE